MPQDIYESSSVEENGTNEVKDDNINNNSVNVKNKRLATAYEEKLLVKITNGQKKELQRVNKLFYPNAIKELTNYLLTSEITRAFLNRLVSILPSKEIEGYYKNGIFSIDDKNLTVSAISKLLGDEYRAINHIEIIKTLVESITNDFSSTLRNINRGSGSEEMMLAKAIESILEKNGVKYSDIVPYKLATKKVELDKDIDEIKKDVAGIIKNEEAVSISKKASDKSSNTTKPINVNLSECVLLKIDNQNDEFFSKLGEDEYKEFFNLLKESKRLRSIKNRILPNNVYLLFVKHSTKENFEQLFKMEKARLLSGSIYLESVEAIYERILDLNLSLSLTVVNHIKNYIIKTKGKEEFSEELNEKYELFVASKAKKSRKSEKVKKEVVPTISLEEEGLNRDLITSFSEKQYEEFFDLFALYKRSKRSNKNLMPDKLYLAFVKYSNAENFKRLYELENQTLTNNKVSIHVTEAFFLRLTDLTIVIGEGVNLVNRVNTLRKKILLRTGKSDLKGILKTRYDNFIQKYNLAKNTSITEVSMPKSPYLGERTPGANSSVVIGPTSTKGTRKVGGTRALSKTIVYSDEETERKKFSINIEYLLPNFIKFRSFDENPHLLNLISKENENPTFIKALFENLDGKFGAIDQDIVSLDSDFSNRSEIYILAFLNRYKESSILNDIFVELNLDLDSLPLNIIVFLKSNLKGDNLNLVLNELNSREDNKKEEKINSKNKLEKSVDKLTGIKSSEVAKKELKYFFENLNNVTSENSDIYKITVSKKLDLILEDNILITGMFSLMHSDMNSFNELYDFDIDNLNKRPDTYLQIFLYLSYLSDDITKLVKVKHICDVRGINYDKMSGKINTRITSYVTSDVVEKILLSSTSLDLKRSVEIDGINDLNLIQKYINRQIEFNGTREIIRVLKDKKGIVSSEYIASVISKLPRDSKLVRDYIINF